MGPMLVKRQGYDPDDCNSSSTNCDGGWWWYSPTAAAIKWGIVGAIFVLFLIIFVGGYWHAQRRMRKGLPPLAYHRWLLPRSQRARFPSQNQPFNFYQYQNGYNDGHQMNPYPRPPPAYNTDYVNPPTYEPPQGASKTAPAQDWVAPPPGPPSSESSRAQQQSAGVRLNEEPLNVGLQNPEIQSSAPPRKNLMNKLNPFK